MKQNLIPFFVADRPASLQILKGIMLKYSEIKIGIMTHIFTSKKFEQIFSDFPNNQGILYGNESLLGKENTLACNLIKMADSGVFGKNGCHIDYEELFEKYNRLGVNFGVIIDVLKDYKKTITSAAKGLKIFKKNKDKYCFKLVGVAQGNTTEEYLKCYDKLISIGFDHIAIGGLLKKVENSARYVKVRNESFMYEVLTTIRKDFAPKWLFALGCYHPSRHKKFEEIGIWGSDYKGWIFNYISKSDTLMNLNKNLSSFEIANGFDDGFKEELRKTNELEENLKNLQKKQREEKNPKIRKDIREKMEAIKDKLKLMYATLLNRREYIVANHHLPIDYRNKVATFKMVINENEQAWRFRQVREYIEKNVYGKLK